MSDTTTLNRKLKEFEPVQLAWQKREAFRRLEEQFEFLMAKGDVNAVKRLIEHMHLAAGNRRKQHVEVNLERRSG